MDILNQSIAQLDWPKERVSTTLCPKCGDCFHLDLHRYKFDETLHSVRSGYSPDRSERVAYSQSTAEALRDLDRCQSELRRLEGLVNALAEQKELLLKYMTGIHSITSPIHKLPHEIMCKVFEYICCENMCANYILPGPGNRKRLPTLILSRVCIQWYNLVTSTPVLWSSFGTMDWNSPHNLSLFKVFLKRSHPHPVDFAVDDAEMLLKQSENPTFSPESLCPITASANRWRRVYIHSTEYFVRAMFQPLIACRQTLPALVSLDIKSETRNAIDFPITCPNLKNLTLGGVTLGTQPLPAITHLELKDLDPEQASRLIASCSNVQDVTFTSLSRHIAPPMTSCNARSLTIKFVGFHDNIDKFLCSLDFPELVHFTILDRSDMDPGLENIHQNTEHLGPMEWSHRHLTHLSLHSIKFPPNQLLCLFCCMPTVIVLDLAESSQLSRTPGVYLCLKALIAPLQKNQQKEPEEDRENDMTLSPGDQFHGRRGGDDEENEESLDWLEKKEDFKVPEGLCLFPRLKELNLVIRPRNKLLLQLLRSRWRPSALPVSSDDDSGSGACICLQTLRLKYPGVPGTRALGRLREFEKSLYIFKKAGMVVDIFN